MNVRWARTTDLPEIVALLHASFDAAVTEYITYMQAGIADYLSTFLNYPDLCPDRRFLVAKDSGDVLLGFAEFGRLAPAIGFLSYICVDQSARGRGIAYALINSYLADTPELKELQLDVFEDNLTALRLYNRLGFVPLRRSGWWVRPRPEQIPIAVSQVAIKNLPHALLSYRQFGFCEFIAESDGRPLRFGRIGEATLRCFDTDLFEESKTLHTVMALFPELKHAFLVVPSDVIVNIGHLMKVSIRMTWDLDTLDHTSENIHD